MWGSSSSPIPGMFSDSSSSGEVVSQPVGEVVEPGLSSLDPAAGSSAGSFLEEKEKDREDMD